MILFPAVDIKDGSAVRLKQGQADKKTVYFKDPVKAALKWKEQGASWLHVVDLDGAFSSHGKNLDLIKAIISETGLNIQLGGGIRTLKDMETRLEAGAKRVIIGTAALENSHLLKEGVNNFGAEAVACGIDALNGKAAVKGWVELSQLTPLEMALRAKEQGIEIVIYTDISKDGMLSGPNLDGTASLIEQTGMRIIASGGISCVEDLVGCAHIGAYGAITGQAVYTGAIDLKQALKKLEEI